MKKFSGSRIMTAVLAFLVIAAFVFVIALSRRYFETGSYIEKLHVMLDGEYSVDGGEWKPVSPAADCRQPPFFAGHPGGKFLARKPNAEYSRL